MLSVQRLRVLREVATRGSFSAAADALSYSQSAVSQAVAALEAELGVTLVDRARPRVRPTVAGEALVEHAEVILKRLETAQADIAAITGMHAGRLRMASFPTAGAALMPLAIATFRAAHPGVDLTLAEGEPEEIALRLRAREFDLALLFEFHGVSERVVPGLYRVDLLDDPMHLALPMGHPLVEKPRLQLGDLRNELWVQTAASSPCARHVVRSCHASGFEPSVSFESDDYQTVQGLVAAGVGVALIPRLALPSVRDDICIRALYPHSPVRKILAATAHGAGVMPAVTTMLDVLRAAAGKYHQHVAQRLST